MNTHARKATAAIALSLALITLGACSSKNEPLKADSNNKPTAGATATPKTPAASAGPAVGADETGIKWCQNVKPESFKQTGEYTPAQVADAYCELITFNGEFGITNLATTSDDYSTTDIMFARDWLTNSAFAALTKNYTDAIADIKAGKFDGTGQASVSLLTNLAETQQGYTFHEDSALTTGRTWTPADYSIDGTKDSESGATRLFMKVSFTDTLLLEKDGKPFTVDKTRDMEFALSPTGDEQGPHSWKIDGWNGKTSYGKEKPYTDPK